MANLTDIMQDVRRRTAAYRDLQMGKTPNVLARKIQANKSLTDYVNRVLEGSSLAKISWDGLGELTELMDALTQDRLVANTLLEAVRGEDIQYLRPMGDDQKYRFPIAALDNPEFLEAVASVSGGQATLGQITAAFESELTDDQARHIILHVAKEAADESEPWAEDEAPTEGQLGQGDLVLHDVYGEGEILDLDPAYDTAHVQFTMDGAPITLELTSDEFTKLSAARQALKEIQASLHEAFEAQFIGQKQAADGDCENCKGTGTIGLGPGGPHAGPAGNGVSSFHNLTCDTCKGSGKSPDAGTGMKTAANPLAMGQEVWVRDANGREGETLQDTVSEDGLSVSVQWNDSNGVTDEAIADLEYYDENDGEFHKFSARKMAQFAVGDKVDTSGNPARDEVESGTVTEVLENDEYRVDFGGATETIQGSELKKTSIYRFAAAISNITPLDEGYLVHLSGDKANQAGASAHVTESATDRGYNDYHVARVGTMDLAGPVFVGSGHDISEIPDSKWDAALQNALRLHGLAKRAFAGEVTADREESNQEAMDRLFPPNPGAFDSMTGPTDLQVGDRVKIVNDLEDKGKEGVVEFVQPASDYLGTRYMVRLDDGTGADYSAQAVQKLAGLMTDLITCKTCNGQGMKDGHICPDCGGNGMNPSAKSAAADTAFDLMDRVQMADGREGTITGHPTNEHMTSGSGWEVSVDQEHGAGVYFVPTNELTKVSKRTTALNQGDSVVSLMSGDLGVIIGGDPSNGFDVMWTQAHPDNTSGSFAGSETQEEMPEALVFVAPNGDIPDGWEDAWTRHQSFSKRACHIRKTDGGKYEVYTDSGVEGTHDTEADAKDQQAAIEANMHAHGSKTAGQVWVADPAPEHQDLFGTQPMEFERHGNEECAGCGAVSALLTKDDVGYWCTDCAGIVSDSLRPKEGKTAYNPGLAEFDEQGDPIAPSDPMDHIGVCENCGLPTDDLEIWEFEGMETKLCHECAATETQPGARDAGGAARRIGRRKTAELTYNDIEGMKQNPEWLGFGYLGHESRTHDTDQALARACNQLGLTAEDAFLYANSRPARHLMDGSDHSDAKFAEDINKHIGDLRAEGKTGSRTCDKCSAKPGTQKFGEAEVYCDDCAKGLKDDRVGTTAEKVDAPKASPSNGHAKMDTINDVDGNFTGLSPQQTPQHSDKDVKDAADKIKQETAGVQWPEKVAGGACSACSGAGHTGDMTCNHCNGTGSEPDRGTWQCPNPECGMTNVGASDRCIECLTPREAKTANQDVGYDNTGQSMAPEPVNTEAPAPAEVNAPSPTEPKLDALSFLQDL